MKNILLAAAVCIIMCCGTRKSETTISNTENKTGLDLQDDTKTKLQNNTGNTTEGQKETAAATQTKKKSERMRPANPNKPMKKTDPDGKTTIYENAILESGEEETQHHEQGKESYKQKDTSTISATVDSKLDLKANTEGATSNKGKATNREGISWIAIVVIFAGLAIGFFIAWYKSRKKNQDEEA